MLSNINYKQNYVNNNILSSYLNLETTKLQILNAIKIILLHQLIK